MNYFFKINPSPRLIELFKIAFSDFSYIVTEYKPTCDAISARDIPEIHPRYTRDSPEIHPRYTRDSPEIQARHGVRDISRELLALVLHGH